MIQKLVYVLVMFLVISSCHRKSKSEGIVEARLDHTLINQYFKGDASIALNYLLENYGVATISAGQYLLDPNKVKLPQREVSIVGEGNVVFRTIGRGSLFTVIDSDLSLSNITFKDVLTTVELKLNRESNLSIKNCTFLGGFRYVVFGMREYDVPVNFSFTDNVIDGHTDVKIIGSRGGLWLDCAYSNVVISNNVIRDINSDRATRAVGISSVFDKVNANVEIKNNKIENISGAQSNEVQAIMAFADNTVIDGNVISNISANKLPSDDCEGIYTKSLHTTISNNVLYDAGNSEGAIVVKGTKRIGKPKTWIHHNNIEDKRPTTSNNQYANGIVVRTPENTIIEDNTIKGVYARGIEIEGSNIFLTKNVIVRRNIISEIGGDGLKLISNCKGCGDIIIEDNIFKSINVEKAKKSVYPIYIGTGLTDIGDLKNVSITNNQVDKNSQISNNVLVYRRSESHNIDEVDILNNQFENAKNITILDNLKSKEKSLILSKSIGGSIIRKK